MNEKIKSISEAFSMQPSTRYVTTQENYGLYHENKPSAAAQIAEIKLETVEIGRKYGDPIEDLYYVGYNFDGKKLFQYLALTVNVEFL